MQSFHTVGICFPLQELYFLLPLSPGEYYKILYGKTGRHAHHLQNQYIHSCYLKNILPGADDNRDTLT